MKAVRISLMPMVALGAALALAGCDRKEEPAGDAEGAGGDTPRSIFQEDPAEGGEGVLPVPQLPPLETTLSFADDTSDLTEAVRAELATILGSQQVDAGGRIVLRGHSDSVGSDEENLEASLKRAEAVRDFLVENGIAEERITVIAFGEQNPISPNALPDGSPNEEGRATNRRVEVTVETGRQKREQTLIETLTEGEEESDATAASSPARKEARNPSQ